MPVAYLVAAKVRRRLFASGVSTCRCRRFAWRSPSLRSRGSSGPSLPPCSTCCCRRASFRSWDSWAHSWRPRSSAWPATFLAVSVSSKGLMVVFLHPFLTTEQLLPALVVFRAVYYLIPLTVALVLLLVDELGQPRSSVAQVGGVLGPLTEQLTPRVLAALTFLAGVVLLLSGAIPASPGRLSWIERVLPLAVVEGSHFLGSVAGAVLLVISQGLSRRLDGAYYFAVVTIVAGAVASILKGLDFEEAVLLVGVLLVLRRARPAFYRRTAFLDTRPSPDRIAATIAALGASIWLTLFAHQHVAYSHELWWQFAFSAGASRSLRASVGAALVLLIFGVARLVAPAPHEARTAGRGGPRPGRAASSRSSRRRCPTSSTCGTRRCSSTMTRQDSSCTASRGARGWRSAIPSGRRRSCATSSGASSNVVTTSTARRCSTKSRRSICITTPISGWRSSSWASGLASTFARSRSKARARRSSGRR